MEENVELQENEKKALGIVKQVAKDMAYEKGVENITYRSDYADYVLLLEGDFICMVREKLIETFEADKTGDVEREIQLCLKRAEKFQDFDGEEAGDPSDQVI